MDSFYAGPPGISFIIAKSYPSVAAMVEDFKLGPKFEAVHFNEYVLINTENKNSDENGRIYRRGLEFSNDMGGAQYVGTIVGPAGLAPMLELATIEKVKEEKEKVGPDQEYRFKEGEYKVPTSLVPGKVDGEEQYNDSIKWATCSVRDENGSDCTAYIGFQIPYTVIDFTASSVDPYHNRDDGGETEDFTNTGLVTRQDGKDHPFFELWHIDVPKGIKGDTFKNFRVVPADDGIEYGENEENKEDDVSGSRAILVYDYYHYDKKAEGEFTSLYLGDFNKIDDVKLDAEGTLTVQYSHDDDDVFPKAIKWIKSVSLNTATGLFTVTYNHDTDAQEAPTKYETYIDWVSNIVVTDDGKVKLQYPHKEETELDVTIKWITDLSVEEDGSLVVNFNDGSNQRLEKAIKWIDDVVFNEDGSIDITFNNGDTKNFSGIFTWLSEVTLSDDGTLDLIFNDGTHKTFEKKIKWIQDIDLSNEGVLTVNYNNEEEPFTKTVKWPATLDIQTEKEEGGEGSGDQKVHVTYTDGQEVIIGNPLNYIMSVAKTPDFHLIVKYSDPVRREEIKTSEKNYKGEDGTGYNNELDWLDLGSIIDEDALEWKVQ